MKSTKSKPLFFILKCIPLFCFAVFSLNNLSAQTNTGSNSVTNCGICTPTDYFIINNTPDVSSRTIAAAINTTGGGTAWDTSPLPSPPNGHLNFITLRNVDNGSESLSTTIDGLTIGTNYHLTFYALTAANSIYSPLYQNTFWYQVSDNPLQNVLMTVQEQWQEITISFTATALSQTLSLGVNSTAANASEYSSVNISISANSVILACNAGTENPSFN